MCWLRLCLKENRWAGQSEMYLGAGNLMAKVQSEGSCWFMVWLLLVRVVVTGCSLFGLVYGVFDVNRKSLPTSSN